MARVVIAGVAHPITPRRGGLVLCGNASEQAALPATRLSYSGQNRWSAERCSQSLQAGREMNRNRVASPIVRLRATGTWQAAVRAYGPDGEKVITCSKCCGVLEFDKDRVLKSPEKVQACLDKTHKE